MVHDIKSRKSVHIPRAHGIRSDSIVLVNAEELVQSSWLVPIDKGSQSSSNKHTPAWYWGNNWNICKVSNHAFVYWSTYKEAGIKRQLKFKSLSWNIQVVTVQIRLKWVIAIQAALNSQYSTVCGCIVWRPIQLTQQLHTGPEASIGKLLKSGLLVKPFELLHNFQYIVDLWCNHQIALQTRCNVVETINYHFDDDRKGNNRSIITKVAQFVLDL